MCSAATVVPTRLSMFATDDDRWAALVARDHRADGCFVYSVRTTGIFCRPSCAARLPRRSNVCYHATPDDARRAGFRPCKRCRPTDISPQERQRALIIAACRRIETAEDSPTLQELADHAGLSRFHFQRLFKQTLGITPKAYVAAHRAQRLRRELSGQGSITNALLTAGFHSAGNVYAGKSPLLGMPPATYQAGGANETIRFAVGQCSLGAILVAATDKGVCAIALGDHPEPLVHELQDQFPQAQFVGGDTGFEKLVARVVGLIESPTAGIDLPLDIRGTAFQQRVWQALRNIPPGETISYTELAQRIGRPSGARAVASACAANRIAVAIPCHRVVRTDGSLTGYRWGIPRKRQLLNRERDLPQ